MNRARALSSRVVLVCLAVLPLLLNVPLSAWAIANQTSAGPNLTNVNLTTGAVAAFEIMLLGLAAAILLMGRLLIPKKTKGPT
jgi:alpha-D-ribose 1-methylphosphonate 5-triphosphate synthase subunit PhnL